MSPLLSTERARNPADICQWNISERRASALVDEASKCTFVRNVGTTYGAKVSPRRVTSPYDMASAPAGVAAHSLATSEEATSLLGWFTGASLRLTGMTYVFYVPGSFIGVHTDRSGCVVNLLVQLAGEPTFFESFPALVDESATAVFHLAKRGQGFIDGGDLVPLAGSGSAVAFVGSVLPHQRRPATEPLLMLSLCYDFLEPRGEE